MDDELQLERLMLMRGVTDTELAQGINCRKSSVNQWKNGDKDPRSTTLKAICRYLKCSADEFLNFTPPYQGGLKRRYQDIFLATTRHGRYDSRHFLRMATKMRETVGKPTEMECWLMELAEALYKLELTTRQIDKGDIPPEQLSMFHNQP